MTIPSVLLLRPSHQPAVQTGKNRNQGRLGEPSVIVDPTSNHPTKHPGQIVEALVALRVDSPLPNRGHDLLGGLATHPWKKAQKELPLAIDRLTRSKHEPQKVERDSRIDLVAVAVTAVDDFRLLRVQFQPASCEPLLHRPLNRQRLHFGTAMDDDVVRITLERGVGMVVRHPTIECVMQKQVRQQRRDHTTLCEPPHELRTPS